MTAMIAQGFGELFLDEMSNFVSVVIMVFAFIVLNVVMLNLLIARMSDTYETTKAEGVREMMVTPL